MSLYDWKKVLLGDESVCCVTYGTQDIRAWRMKQEEYDMDCMIPSIKFAAVVTV